MTLKLRKGLLVPIALVLFLAPTFVSAQLSFERIASGLPSPVFVTHAPGDSERLYIVLQGGQIRIYNLTTGSLNGAPFMTVPGVSSGGERGLLGLAFHPDYQNNGLFYVDFTDSSGGDTRITQFSRLTADTGDANSGVLLIEFNQPQSNHNGGWIGFGPDGYLYAATGDGGGANDSGPGHTSGTGNAQDITNNLLGKMLRFDVNSDDFPGDPNRNYGIPPSNPFVGITGDDEIFLYGLRNPWRCSFDRLTGDLWIGDVGQNAKEEITLMPAGSPGGENYGWRNREATNGSHPPGGSVDPVYFYTQGGSPGRGFSITGGYVYRGPLAGLQGNYFFSDYVIGQIRSFRFDGSDEGSFDGTNFDTYVNWYQQTNTDIGSIGRPSAFGEDLEGNLYVCDLSGGEVFKLVDVGTETPTSFDTLSGNLISGGLAELQESDNQKVIVRSVSAPVCSIEVNSTSPTTTPSLLTFTLEASTRSSQPDVDQIIELYNFRTQEYEEIDRRAARSLGDAITTAQPTGDLSRFVETATSGVRARLTIRRDVITRGLQGFFDHAFWTIAD